MLRALISITNNSITIFDNSSVVELNKLSKKTNFVFASRQFADTLKNIPKRIKAIFTLEDDENKADHYTRFATGEHFIFQLADELYRCYKDEAIECFASSDRKAAKIKEDISNRIHEELKRSIQIRIYS